MSRDEALRIALAYEDASKKARAGQLTENHARKVIADIFALGNRRLLPCSTIREFLKSWVERKSVEAGEKTHRRYQIVVGQLLEFLGHKAGQDLIHLDGREILGFRDDLIARVSPGTVNFSIKVLRSALNQAKRDGLVLANEAEKVSLLRRERFDRRPFTLDEIRKVLAVADEEWKGMVLMGLYTGMRLGDVASITWAQIDLDQGEINVQTRKTGRRVCLPVAKPLMAYLKPRATKSSEPVFRWAHDQYDKSKYDGSLSHGFYRLLVKAGLLEKRTHDATGVGRSGRHEGSKLSFHCLRHTATSLLKNAGVSGAIVQDIIGHESPAVSRSYTHIDFKTKQEALDKLPVIQ